MVFQHFNLYLGKTQTAIYIHRQTTSAHSTYTSTVLTDKLTPLHKARQAFNSSESSEGIRRALKNNVRTSEDTKYITEDSVYFKKINEKRWR